MSVLDVWVNFDLRISPSSLGEFSIFVILCGKITVLCLLLFSPNRSSNSCRVAFGMIVVMADDNIFEDSPSLPLTALVYLILLTDFP